MPLVTLKNGKKTHMGEEMFCGAFSKPSNPKHDKEFFCINRIPQNQKEVVISYKGVIYPQEETLTYGEFIDKTKEKNLGYERGDISKMLKIMEKGVGFTELSGHRTYENYQKFYINRNDGSTSEVVGYWHEVLKGDKERSNLKVYKSIGTKKPFVLERKTIGMVSHETKTSEEIAKIFQTANNVKIR